jgi:hypothetical protein
MASLRNLVITILRLAGTASITAALRCHARRSSRSLQTIMKALTDFAGALLQAQTRVLYRAVGQAMLAQYLAHGRNRVTGLGERQRGGLLEADYLEPDPHQVGAQVSHSRRHKPPRPRPLDHLHAGHLT